MTAVDPEEADVIVALGGDGFMLQTLHAFMNTGKPIYGMNCGSVGFLMNEFREDDLPRAHRAAPSPTPSIRSRMRRRRRRSATTHRAYAINEVSLLRQSYQAAKLRISIDGHVRLEELICDGVLVATPAGSTAYNLSAHGPDPADLRAAPRADADQRLPAAPLARRAAAGPGRGAHRGARGRASGRSTPSPTMSSSSRWSRSSVAQDNAGREPDHVRPRPLAGTSASSPSSSSTDRARGERALRPAPASA